MLEKNVQVNEEGNENNQSCAKNHIQIKYSTLAALGQHKQPYCLVRKKELIQKRQ